MAVTETSEQKPFAELSAFQRDILAVLARDGSSYGLAIKRAIESVHGTKVNHGRLYPNLDDLVQDGLIDKSARDNRTNDYALSKKGRNVVRSQFVWLDGCLGSDK